MEIKSAVSKPGAKNVDFIFHGASFLPGREVKQEDGTMVYVPGKPTWRGTNNTKVRVNTFRRDGDTNWFFLEFSKPLSKEAAAEAILARPKFLEAWVADATAAGWTEQQAMALLNEVAGKAAKTNVNVLQLDDDEADVA